MIGPTERPYTIAFLERCILVLCRTAVVFLYRERVHNQLYRAIRIKNVLGRKTLLVYAEIMDRSNISIPTNRNFRFRSIPVRTQNLSE
jgi:hypothetical protein